MRKNYTLKKTFIMVFLCLFTSAIWATDETVPLGGNIQTAINNVASSGGGIVTIATGIHIITTPIRMKSNVTLQGEGNWATTIKTNTDIQVITADAEGLVNLVIQNIKIEGINSVSGGGIQITSQGVDHDNIKILNVHCTKTGWGVHIKGCKNLLIKDCLFDENGAVSKEGFAHNLYLRRVYDAEVRDSKFLNSISANGINISYSERVKVYNCEMSGNYFRGIRAAVTDGYLVHDCIVKNNGDRGIYANSESGQTATINIDIRRNCVSGNTLEGIKAISGVTGVTQDNNSYGNGTDYSFPSSVTQFGNVSDASSNCTYSTSPTVGLSAITVDGTVALNWGVNNIDAVRQDVFRDTDSDPSGRQLIAGNVNGADYVDSSIVTGTAYYYWVKVSDGSVSYNSNVASPEPEALAPAVILTAEPGNGFVTLNWELQGIDLGDSGIQGVFRKVTLDDGGRSLLKNRISGSTYTDNSAENGVSYLYYLKVTDKDGVDHNSEAIEATPSLSLSVDGFSEKQSKIKIYPNPTSNYFTISNALDAKVEVYNLIGKKVLSEIVFSDKQTIDISSLPTQVYIVKINNESQSSSLKLVKK
ncbi:T9SS type A sorting domain-containing protein [Algibacter sp. L1A34]|uniref:T9SS type A sorting domain-containing protein n=1 Tax=Algibacter sp. L1A34 TaxID=2686365 RepID=UPI00131C15F6|nr:T9SS type A sorting domain-containing protein [Algibacter sp. L1A34]